MKATLIFNLVLIAVAAALVSFDHFAYSGEDGIFQIEPMIARLHAPSIPGCLLNCPRQPKERVTP